MCGRYAVEAKIRQRLAEDRAWADYTDALLWENRYNVCPSQQVPVIRVAAAGGFELVPMIWGYVPGFIKEEKPKQQPINARAETVATNGFFRQSFARRRCLIPASGYYEWLQTKPKVPHYIHAIDGAPLLFVGIWDHWHDADRVAIIVCSASDALGRIHDRQPVTIPHEQWQDWLTGEQPESYLLCQQDGLTAYPVSTQVNSPRNQGPELISPV